MRHTRLGHLYRQNLLSDLGFIFARNIPARYVGWTGRGNLGDEALYDAIRALFKDRLSLYSPRRRGWLRDMVDRRAVQFVFLGGGTLLHHSHWARLVERALEANPKARFVVFGTGVADVNAWRQFGYKVDVDHWVRLLQRAAYIGVRGPLSKSHLLDWGVTREVHVVGDPAILFAPEELHKSEPGRRIGINLSMADGQLWGMNEESVVDFGARLVGDLIAGGWEVILFPVIRKDVRVMQRIVSQAKKTSLPFHRGFLNVSGTLTRMAELDVFVGMKLHSVVMASCANVPSIMVEYRPKCRDFMRSIGREKWIIRTDELDNLTAMNAITDLYENRDAHREEIHRNVLRLRGDLITAARTVTETVIVPGSSNADQPK